MPIAKGLSINISINTTPLSAWLNSTVIHYRYFNFSYQPFTSIQINPLFANFTEVYNNFYYLGNFTENNTNIGTIFRLATIAYPQPFVISMIKNNFYACTSNTLNDTLAGSFFQQLCGLYKWNYNVSFSNETPNETNNTIREIVATSMPDDQFTKQLYSLFYTYSSACNSNNSFSYAVNGSLLGKNGYYSVSYNPNVSSVITYSACRGSEQNPALPYFLDYIKYIKSLQLFMQIIDNYTPQVLKYALEYDMKFSNVFPLEKTPDLIQDDIALLGVYPGAIPSGLYAEKMLNYSQLGLPINYFKDNNITGLKNNGIYVYSGVYPNITMFVAMQNEINNYSFYNISPRGSPFSGSLSAGPITYYDSCSGGIGYATATEEEINQMKNDTYKALSSDGLIPFNLYSQMPKTLASIIYGPSIIVATPSNISIQTNKITYGALYYNKTIAYESNITVPFSPVQRLVSLVIPTNAIKDKSAVHQLFATLNNSYSYTMNYYGFNTYFSSPHFTTTSGSYQKVETKVVDNKTVTYTVTCYTQSVSGTMSYNSSLIKIGSKSFNKTFNKRTYINVSTNMSISKVFDVNNNGYADKLNYSFVLYTSSSPEFKSFANLTVPTGTTFTIATENGTPLIDFTSSYPINATITGYGNQSLILYAPTYVFPDIYQNIVYYYPTISTYANNNEYYITFNPYITSITSQSQVETGIIGVMAFIFEGVASTINHILFNANVTNSPAYIMVSAEHQSEIYYLEGCPYTRIGYVCIAPPPQYTLTPNQTQSQADFNLLNPILYTEDMYYSSAVTPSWLCSKVNFWKTILSPIYPSVNNWQWCNPTQKNKGIKVIFYTDSQLLFNETWANFTPQEKLTFLKDLLNSSTYNNYTYYGEGTANQYSLSSEAFKVGKVYSIVFPPTYINQVANLTSSIVVGKSTNVNLTGSYSSLKFDECVFDMCYSTNLLPTKVYTTLFYNYVYNGNYTYTVSVYPNEYENASMMVSNDIEDPATVTMRLTYTPLPINTTEASLSFVAPSTFHIKQISSQNVSLKFANNTLYVYVPELSDYKLYFSFDRQQLPSVMNGKYNFLILPQSFVITTTVAQAYSESTWLAILIVIIIAILMWRTKYFQPLIEDIKNIFKIREQ